MQWTTKARSCSFAFVLACSLSDCIVTCFVVLVLMVVQYVKFLQQHPISKDEAQGGGGLN
jgi:hypothetical protein